MEEKKTGADKGSMLSSQARTISKISKTVIFFFFGLAILFTGFKIVVGENNNEISLKLNYPPSQSNPFLYEMIDSFSKDLERYPEHVETYLLRGSVYCELQLYALCMDDYYTVFRLSPQNVQLYQFRGRAYASIGKPTYAIKDLSHWIASNPKYPIGYFERAEVYLMIKNWELAETDLNRVIKLGGQLEVQYSLRQIILALKLEHSNQDQKALKIYQQLIDRSDVYKSYPLTLLRMADLLINLNRQEEALPLLNELLNLNPANKQATSMWESIMYPNGKPSIAIDEFSFTG